MATKIPDQDREDVRRELKSGRHDPSAAPQPQEVRKHPTEGEKMQFGYATPRQVAEDLSILPDHGKPVPDGAATTDSIARPSACRAKRRGQKPKSSSGSFHPPHT
jgi:hypothetical protein